MYVCARVSARGQEFLHPLPIFNLAGSDFISKVASNLTRYLFCVSKFIVQAGHWYIYIYIYIYTTMCACVCMTRLFLELVVVVYHSNSPSCCLLFTND
jgi:hypothetical protein